MEISEKGVKYVQSYVPFSSVSIVTLSSKCWLGTRVSEAVKGASVTCLHKGHSLASKEY